MIMWQTQTAHALNQHRKTTNKGKHTNKRANKHTKLRGHTRTHDYKYTLNKKADTHTHTHTIYAKLYREICRCIQACPEHTHMLN